MRVNKSKTYILPSVAEGWTKDHVALVVNTYIYHEDYIDCIIVKFKMDKDNYDFIDFVSSLYERDDYVDSFYCGEGVEQLCVVFKIKDVVSLDCFRRGKYSKMNNDFKLNILKYHTLINGRMLSNRIKNILYLAESLRNSLSEKLGVNLPEDAELTSIINKEDEEYGD